MAFDQSTRNRLARFVSDTRSLLAEEFTRQLQNVYGLDPDTGDVTDPARLTLDNAQRETARLLRETMEHYLASADTGTAAKAKKARQETLDRIVREQAFTVLNRLCALRMAEARGLLIESIAKGYQSKGFKLYQRLAGTALGETGECYRVFLFSVFDEFAVDLPVLFDRFSPQGRLFPRETALLAVLNEINHADIDPLWAEDETIGWIYQYFNSVEERRQMRSESQAPRNSRELAVRNQFFTPRYVVEFLTDNTLGRIWYEMTKGETSLKDTCRYLVRRPNEVFLRSLEDVYQAIYGADAAMPEDIFEHDAFAALYKGDTEPAANGKDGFLALAGGALSEETFRAKTGESWEPHGNELIDALRAAILDGRDHPKKDDLVWGWAAVAQYIENSQIGSPYAKNTTAKLENYFRDLLRAHTRVDCLSQDELLKQSFLVPHRPLKDPRDIKMLDPACGSMHFGLYAFDLFERIYDEAWDLEAERGADVFIRPEGLKPLHETYDSKDAFLRDVPRLIIERNIHGIDIDPRAVQIAGLSLWLRAQRSWQNQDVKAQDRPQIQRSNIVCAEPMPGEADMLEEFLKGLRDDRLESLIRRVLDVPENQQVRATARMAEALCDLVRTVWHEMKLAGEAGSLLKIEESLAEAIAKGKQEWEEKLPLFRVTEFGLTEETQATPKVKYYKSVPGEEEDFWNRAEAMVLAALEDYAEQAQGTQAVRKRMFVDDAARGLAFIDLIRRQFDVCLMNPPFGDISKQSKRYVEATYPTCAHDIYPAFVERGYALLGRQGRLGAITNRTGLLLARFSQWRQNTLLSEGSLQCVADLGFGILDEAMVEAAAYVLQHGGATSAPRTITSLLHVANHARPFALCDMIPQAAEGVLVNRGVFLRDLHSFSAVPSQPLAYLCPPALLSIYESHESLEASGRYARVTNQTSDDFRFLRLWWEVPLDSDRWVAYAKGGEYSPYYADLHLGVDWDATRGTYRGYIGTTHRPDVIPASANFFLRPGITYSSRTNSSFSPRILPARSIFANKGPAIITIDEEDAYVMLGVMMSRVFQSFVEVRVAAGDSTSAGTPSRSYDVGILQTVPVPEFTKPMRRKVGDLTKTIVREHRARDRHREESHAFSLASLFELAHLGVFVEHLAEEWRERIVSILTLSSEIEDLVRTGYGLDDKEYSKVEAYIGPHPCHYPDRPREHFLDRIDQPLADIVKEAVESGVGHRSISVKGFYADRRVEVVAHSASVSALSVLRAIPASLLGHDASTQEIAKRRVSALIGVALGRWVITDASLCRTESDPIDPLLEPQCVSRDESSGIAVDDDAHPADVGRQFRIAIDALVGDEASAGIEQELADAVSVRDIRDYLRTSNGFFDDHLKTYSNSRRYAPVYWPLSTPSCSYTLWLCYHRLTDQTLYMCVNDFVDPKLKQVSDEASRLRGKSNRSSAEEKELERLSDLELELKDFRDELLRIARFWKPNLNDGVQITAAPLWKLFQHRQWQNRLKETWEKLEAGEYDWAHLALSIWPDRVVCASHADRSYAIAHDLEDQLWHEVEVGTDRQGSPKYEWQPRDLSEAELATVIDDIKNSRGLPAGDTR